MLEEEKNRSERVAWGTGRVVVRANLRTIQGLLDEGWPLTTVYQRVKNSLAGVSYRQFSEHVRDTCVRRQNSPRRNKRLHNPMSWLKQHQSLNHRHKEVQQMAKNQNLQDNQQHSDLDPESQIQETFTESARRNGEAMKKVHITLQGKGGIGKSFASIVLAQYIKQHDPDVLCLDTDPVNATFSSFPGLHVCSIALLERNNTINERHFDEMMEQIIKADRNVVVDNGAASYVPVHVPDRERGVRCYPEGRQTSRRSFRHRRRVGSRQYHKRFAYASSQLPEGVEWLSGSTNSWTRSKTMERVRGDEGVLGP